MVNLARLKVFPKDGVEIPQYATEGSAGFDLAAAEDHVLAPGEKKVICTGLKFDIPEGLEMQIRPRSGLSLKKTLRICNAPGTIDSDYTGFVGIIMENYGKEEIKINKGDRIAQGVLSVYFRAIFDVVDSVDKKTERGTGGYGSTGN